MISKKKLLNSWLYLILDKKIVGRTKLANIIRQINNSCVDIIQLRDKSNKKETILRDALLIKKLLSGSRRIFIINDYIDIAKLANADGIHLGQEDISISLARRILGENKIIGISCHNLKQALAAQRQGADYISIGPIFPSLTKPEYKAVGLGLIGKIKEKIGLPFFAIGNIKPDNIDRVISYGAMRIAVCRAILKSKDLILSSKFFSSRLTR